ncbi:MAG: peptidylprolyl isomerase [Alteromonadaceae bacterium]|nr:MAG: peptidylprolyl isomerase [Alteromonadaceae bacterium]
MHELLVGEGVQVTLHFSLKLNDGQMIDSNFDGDPATFIFGDGRLLPGFEQVLVGLKEGDRETFVIPPEKGFGENNPGNVHVVGRDTFGEDISIAKGVVVSFAHPSGGELPGVILSFTDDKVTVDFNHPLSGRNITFDIEILSIVPIVKH